MLEPGLAIRPDLAAHVAPPAAEGVVFREIIVGVGIDHAVEKQPVQLFSRVRARIEGRSIRAVIELRIMLHHSVKDIALDAHEAGRRLFDLDESMFVRKRTDRQCAVLDWVERIGGMGGGTNQTVMGDNRSYGAGVYAIVTYQSYLGDPTLLGSDFKINLDEVSFEFKPQIRTNVINKGLVLNVPEGAMGAVPIAKVFAGILPDAGISPVLKEEYQEVTFERKMLLPNWDLATYSQFVGKVNNKPCNLGGNFYAPEVLKFTSFETNYIVVPQVNDDGEPDGFNRWLNLRLHFDWRTATGIGQNNLVANCKGCNIIDDSGNVVPRLPVFDGSSPPNIMPGNAQAGWNHVLAYPGIFHAPYGLAWYKAKFPANVLALFPRGGMNLYDPYAQISGFDAIWNSYFCVISNTSSLV